MTDIVLLGRPNVGKSSLFNALTKTSAALVSAISGVTRDWREGEVQFENSTTITLIDTAGLDDSGDELAGELSAIARQQAQKAVAIMFVIDGKDGVLPADEMFAQEIRRLNKPTLVLVNKADTKQAEDSLAQVMSFGFGEGMLVSAAHTMGIAEVAEWMEQFAISVEEETEEPDPTGPLKMAIVGRPNAGKSTLINHLIGEERLITGDVAGLTRESLEVPYTYKKQEFILIDTPGQRRKAKVVEDLEQASVYTAFEAVKKAEVVVLLVDGSTFDADEGVSKIFHQQDASIAQQAINVGKPIVVAVNKWDNVKDKDIARKQITQHITDMLYNLAGVPVQPICALNGKNVDKMMEFVIKMHGLWHSRTGTSKLNRILEYAQIRKAAPLAKGSSVRIKYMTQTATCPPSFAMWGSRVNTLPDSYKRYLINVLRNELGLHGLPIRMSFKASKNPFDK